MRTIRSFVIALAIAGTAGAATAGERSEFRLADHNGAREIAAGDYAKAEQVLGEALRIAPRDPDLMLNLAQVYARSGRGQAARALYRRVLAQPSEEMLLAGNRSVSSHKIAEQGLQSAGATTLVAR